MFKWPVWIERHGHVYYVGRDLLGHFTTAETIEEPCPHACCRGRERPVKVRRLHDDLRSSWQPRKALTGRAKERAGRARQEYDYASYLHAHYQAAEEATNGYMVTKAGRARGITGGDFFKPGRRPSVEKWGSDELKAWFETKDRAGTRRVLSRTEFDASTRARAA